MKNLKSGFTLCTAYFLVLLFSYAAASKMLDFENFQIQLAQSPLLSAYAGFISYGVIVLEVATAGLLCFTASRRWGLYLSFTLMTAFTVYIWLILKYSDFVPCSCGGILEDMTWEQHLIFNISVTLMALSALVMEEKKRTPGLIRSLAYPVITALCAAGGMVALFLSSEYIMKKENNFTRRFSHHPITEEKRLDLGANSYYFAGMGNGKIMLGNYTNPLLITEVDPSFSRFTHYMVKLDDYHHAFRFLRLYVRGTRFFLADGTTPIIYGGSLKNRYAKTLSYKKIYFDQLAVIDSVRLAFRTLNPNTMTRTLGMLDLRSGKYRLHPEWIKKQKDGIFDTDGLLTADPETGDYYYIYFYRNTVLAVNRTGDLSEQHTIDTTGTAKVRSTLMSDGRMKMSAPSVIVNKSSTATQGLLFNESNLMGKYENREQWKSNSIIDLYNTNRKSYAGSFYIPNKGDDKMIQMFASSEYFYTLIGNEIIRYRYAHTVKENFNTGKPKTVNRVGKNNKL